MKTKKSGVRGSVITSADIEKATKAIGLYLEKLKNNINICAADCTFVLGSGTPLDVALIPFDVVANGGTLRIKKEVLDRFCATWIKFAWGLKCDGAMEFVLSLFRLLDMFSKSGSQNFNHGVFVADYGYFRGSLTTCLYWNTSRLGGYSSGVNADLEKLEDGQKRRDMKICKALIAASEAESRAKGELTEKEICKKQERFAVGDYRQGEPLKETLIRMLKAKEINGFEIVGDAGWVGMCIKDGCIRRNELGDLIRTPKIYSSKVWRKLYQRVRRLLDDVGRRKKKGNRRSRKNRA